MAGRKTEAELKEMFLEMCEFENKCYAEGFELIAGIDEVGRGPLAGPVVASAVILPKGFELLGLNDSKKLSKKKREAYFEIIKENAISYGIGIVSEAEIDEINIYEASKVAMKRAIEGLNVTPDFLLIDAMKLDLNIPQENLIKGDMRSISIAAASVIAKETRDKMMEEYSVEYPGYGFEKHAGYGTKQHVEALRNLGVTPIHRKTFAPVKKLLEPTLFDV